MTDIAWAELLADLTAKRDALNAVIDGLNKYFGGGEAAAPAPVRRGRSGRSGRRPKKAKPVRQKATRQKRAPAEAVAPPSSSDAPPEHRVAMMTTADLVQARDAAILARLKKGPAPKKELIDAMPAEPLKTPEQRESDCGNSLSRLRLKKLIVQVDEGWAVA